MRNNIKFNTGLTLIELLLAITILAILTGIAVPFYNDVISRKDLNVAENTLITTLHKARRIASAENSYVDVSLEGSSIQLSTQAQGKVESFQIPSDISFDSSQRFSINPNGIVSSGENSAESDTRIHFAHKTNSALEKTISISTTGLVAVSE